MVVTIHEHEIYTTPAGGMRRKDRDGRGCGSLKKEEKKNVSFEQKPHKNK